MFWINPDGLGESEYTPNSIQHSGLPAETYQSNIGVESIRYRGHPLNAGGIEQFKNKDIWICDTNDEVIIPDHRDVDWGMEYISVIPRFLVYNSSIESSKTLKYGGVRLFPARYGMNKEHKDIFLHVFDVTSQIAFLLRLRYQQFKLIDQKRKKIVDGKYADPPLVETKNKWVCFKVIDAQVSQEWGFVTPPDYWDNMQEMVAPVMFNLEWSLVLGKRPSHPSWKIKYIEQEDGDVWKNNVHAAFLTEADRFGNILNWSLQDSETFVGGLLE
jgi:hypothetical protein